MKLFDTVATLVVVALVFVALLLQVLAPKLPPVRGGAPAAAEESPPRALSFCKTLLQATIDGDFASFKNVCLKEGDGQMKLFAAQRGTREIFQSASETVAPLCAKGYELQYLGTLRQRGSEVYLWRLVPRSGPDEFLVRLTLKAGKISGFFFQ